MEGVEGLYQFLPPFPLLVIIIESFYLVLVWTFTDRTGAILVTCTYRINTPTVNTRINELLFKHSEI
jgi:hypothetical protein